MSQSSPTPPVVQVGRLRYVSPYLRWISAPTKVTPAANVTLLQLVMDANPQKGEAWCRYAITSDRVGIGHDSHPDSRRLVTNPSLLVTNPKSQIWILMHQHEPVVVCPPTLHTRDLILHEDDNLIAVAKPAGLPCVPGPGFMNNLTALLEAEQERKLYPVHRLDRLTSGVFLLAKQKKAAASLSKSIADRHCRKGHPNPRC